MIYNVHYPSKTFLKDTKLIILSWRDFNINIAPSWRRKIIADGIADWATSKQHIKEISQSNIRQSNIKQKYFIRSMFWCHNLMAMHFFAIGNGYTMSYEKDMDDIKILYRYTPDSPVSHILDRVC
jgi:hypothetical protein